MNVRFTLQADADIIDCYLYGFRTFGREQADRYEQGLRHAIGLIADNPRIASERLEAIGRYAFIITPNTTLSI